MLRECSPGVAVYTAKETLQYVSQKDLQKGWNIPAFWINKDVTGGPQEPENETSCRYMQQYEIVCAYRVLDSPLEITGMRLGCDDAGLSSL